MVFQLRNDGLSMKKIGEMIKKTKSTIHYATERYRELKNFENRDLSGKI